MEEKSFFAIIAWYELSTLKLLLENHFHRITLVNKAMTERLTIDTGVHFHHLITGTEARLENLAHHRTEARRENLFSPSG